jgi:hypothetical protein
VEIKTSKTRKSIFAAESKRQKASINHSKINPSLNKNLHPKLETDKKAEGGKLKAESFNQSPKKSRRRKAKGRKL